MRAVYAWLFLACFGCGVAIAEITVGNMSSLHGESPSSVTMLMSFGGSMLLGTMFHEVVVTYRFIRERMKK